MPKLIESIALATLGSLVLVTVAEAKDCRWSRFETDLDVSELHGVASGASVSSQATSPNAALLPTGQTSHPPVDVELETWPGGHGGQPLAPSSLNRPTGQSAQCVAPPRL